MPSTLGVVASGEDVLNDAVLWLDASRSVAGENTMVNYGKGGSALNAQYGSTGGSDTNDPLLLTHAGTNYLYLPGPNSNYASTPSAAPLDVTGDLEVVLRVASDDWTPATQYVLISKRSATNLSWQLSLITTGVIQFSFNNGTVNLFADSAMTAGTPLTDGTAYWIRFRRVASTGAVTLESAPDQPTEPSSYTQTWTSSGTRTAGAMAAQAVELAVGASRGGIVSDCAQAKFYRAIVRNGIGGTTVFDANFTTGITSGGQTTFTESSANAATVTINRATSGRKSVAVVRPVLLFGTDDYLEVADNDLLDFGAAEPFTVLAVHRQWATFVGSGSVVMKKTATGATGVGWALRSGAGTPAQVIFDGYDGTTVAVPASPSRTAGATSITIGLASTTQFTTYLGNTAGTPATRPPNSIANSEVMRVGRASGVTTSYNDMELVAVAVWRRVLSTNEIATVVARYA